MTSNGSIALSGLLPLTSYDINYKNNNVATTVNITTNNSGVAIITALGAGSYTDFSITNISGCSSGVYPGPVTYS